MFSSSRPGDKKKSAGKKALFKKIAFWGVGTTTTAIAIGIGIFLYLGGALSSTSAVYVFKSELHCNNSTLSNELPFDCAKSYQIAMTKASLFEWNFKNIEVCAKYYGKGNCGYNGKRSLSIKPDGFAFFPDSENILIPIYQSPALGLHLLPSGFPVKLGKTKITLSDQDNLSNILKPKSLSSEGCYKPHGSFKMKCTSRYNILSDYNQAGGKLEGLEH